MAFLAGAPRGRCFPTLAVAAVAPTSIARLPHAPVRIAPDVGVLALPAGAVLPSFPRASASSFFSLSSTCAVVLRGRIRLGTAMVVVMVMVVVVVLDTVTDSCSCSSSSRFVAGARLLVVVVTLLDVAVVASSGRGTGHAAAVQAASQTLLLLLVLVPLWDHAVGGRGTGLLLLVGMPAYGPLLMMRRRRRGKEGLVILMALLLLLLRERRRRRCGGPGLVGSLGGKELERLLGGVDELLHEGQLVPEAEETPRGSRQGMLAVMEVGGGACGCC